LTKWRSCHVFGPSSGENFEAFDDRDPCQALRWEAAPRAHDGSSISAEVVRRLTHHSSATYEEGKLIYAARTRNGFTPRLRQDLMKLFVPLKADASPFANLPKRSPDGGAGLTASILIQAE
jgi:hypothetical protein